MPNQPNSVPPEILACVREGRNIEAIKLLREHTGLGLREAKDEVERLAAELKAGGAENAPTFAGHGGGDGEVPADIAKLAREGRKIEAIKLLRDRTGCGLKEGKERIEALRALRSQRGVCLCFSLSSRLPPQPWRQ